MKSFPLILLFLILISPCCRAAKAAAQPATPPADPAHFELFLLVGQSNMAGRAPVQPEDKVADPRVLVLDREDHWVTQGEPIHFDKNVAGVGLSYTFAKLLAEKEPGVTIGLIPCAFGGTTLAQWNPKSDMKKLYPPFNLYENAIRRAQMAMKSGTLKGILWHQGEGDSNPRASTYAARLAPLAASFRADLHSPDAAFIAGELGYYLYAKYPDAQMVNQQIDSLPTIIPFCAVASAKELVDKGDHIHFDNTSQKKLGQRYFDAFEQARNSSAPTRH